MKKNNLKGIVLLALILAFSFFSSAQEETMPETDYDDLARQLLDSYNPADALRFYENPDNVGLYPEIDVKYFGDAGNVGKNQEADDKFFSGSYSGATAASLRDFLKKDVQHGTAAANYFSTKFKAAYRFENIADDFTYNAEEGSLHNNGKRLFLNDFSDDLTIKEIRSVMEGFQIIREEEGQVQDISVGGDAKQSLAYSSGKIQFIDEKGEIQSFTIKDEATVSFSFRQDGAVEIDGPAAGQMAAAGDYVRFSNRAGKLSIRADGSISADNAEVTTSLIYADGNFDYDKNNNRISAWDHGSRDRKLGNLDQEGRTIVIDRMTRIGVKTQGQLKINNNKIEINLDQTSARSEFYVSPGKEEERLVEQSEINSLRQQARTVKPTAGDLGGNGEVWIRQDLQTKDVIVTAKGRVDIGFYHLGIQGGAMLSETEPRFIGENGKAEFDSKIGLNTILNVRGRSTYSDSQYSGLRNMQDGASLKITRNQINSQDVVYADCFSCQEGNAVEIRKRIVLANPSLMEGVFKEYSTAEVKISLEAGKDGLKYLPSSLNLGSIAQGLEAGGKIAVGRDLLVKIPCGSGECNLQFAQDTQTKTPKMIYETYHPASGQVSENRVSIQWGISEFTGKEVVITSRNNLENINKLARLIEQGNLRDIAQAGLQFDPDPALRNLVRKELGLDINLISNAEYASSQTRALGFIGQLRGAGIDVDINGNPLTAEAQKKITALLRQREGQGFYLYTAAMINLKQAEAERQGAIRSSCTAAELCEVSDKVYKETLARTKKEIAELTKIRKVAFAETEKKQLLRDMKDDAVPPGGQETLARAGFLKKQIDDVKEGHQSAQLQLINNQKEISELNNKLSGLKGREKAEAEQRLIFLKNQKSMLGEEIEMRELQIADYDARLAREIGSAMGENPKFAARIAAEAGDLSLVLDIAQQVRSIAPEEGEKLVAQYVVQQEGTQAQDSIFRIKLLMAAGDLSGAVKERIKMKSGDHLDSYSKEADDLVYRAVLDKSREQWKSSSSLLLDRHQVNVEEYQGFGGTMTLAGRALSPVNLAYLATFGEIPSVVKIYDDMTQKSLGALEYDVDKNNALHLVLASYRKEGRSLDEAIKAIREGNLDLEVLANNPSVERSLDRLSQKYADRNLFRDIYSSAFFSNVRKQSRGEALTSEDLANHRWEQLQSQISFHNGKAALVEDELQTLRTQFSGTSTAMMAEAKIKDLNSRADYTFLSNRNLEKYGDLAMEAATIFDVVPVGMLISGTKAVSTGIRSTAAIGIKGAELSTRVNTAENLAQTGFLSRKIHLSSEARQLEKLKTEAAAAGDLAKARQLEQAQQALSISGSKTALGEIWDKTLGRQIFVTKAEREAFQKLERAREAYQLEKIGLKTEEISETVVSNLIRASENLERASLSSRMGATISNKISAAKRQDIPLVKAKPDLTEPGLVSPEISLAPSELIDLERSMARMDQSGSQLTMQRGAIRYDPATIPDHLKPEAARAEGLIAKSGIQVEVIDLEARMALRAEVNLAQSELSAAKQVMEVKKAVGADVLPPSTASIATDLPPRAAARVRLEAEASRAQSIEESFDLAASSSSSLRPIREGELSFTGRMDLPSNNAPSPTLQQIVEGRKLQEEINAFKNAQPGTAEYLSLEEALHQRATLDSYGASKLPLFDSNLPEKHTLYEISMSRESLKKLNSLNYDVGSLAISTQHQQLIRFAKENNLPVTTLQKTTFIAVPEGAALTKNDLLRVAAQTQVSVKGATGEAIQLRVGIAEGRAGEFVETRLKTRRSLEYAAAKERPPVEYGTEVENWYKGLPDEIRNQEGVLIGGKAQTNDIFQGYDPVLRSEFENIKSLRQTGGEAYRNKLIQLAETDLQDANFNKLEVVKSYQADQLTGIKEGDYVFSIDGVGVGRSNQEDIIRLTRQNLPDNELAQQAGKKVDRNIQAVNDNIRDTYSRAVDNIPYAAEPVLARYREIAKAAGYDLPISKTDDLKDFLKWEYRNRGSFRGGDETFAVFRKEVIEANPDLAKDIQNIVKQCGEPCGYQIRVGVKEVASGEAFPHALSSADQGVRISKELGNVPVRIDKNGKIKALEIELDGFQVAGSKIAKEGKAIGDDAALVVFEERVLASVIPEAGPRESVAAEVTRLALPEPVQLPLAGKTATADELSSLVASADLSLGALDDPLLQRDVLNNIIETARARGDTATVQRYTELAKRQEVVIPKYYHTTNAEGLSSILREGRIKYNEGAINAGAWTSSRMEVGDTYGDYVIVFGSDIEKGNLVKSNQYFDAHIWLGWREDIPVKKDRTPYIVARDDKVEEARRIAAEAGWGDVEVIPLSQAEAQRQIILDARINSPDRANVLLERGYNPDFREVKLRDLTTPSLTPEENYQKIFDSLEDGDILFNTPVEGMINNYFLVKVEDGKKYIISVDVGTRQEIKILIVRTREEELAIEGAVELNLVVMQFSKTGLKVDPPRAETEGFMKLLADGEYTSVNAGERIPVVSRFN